MDKLNEFDRIVVVDLAYKLINISFYTENWSEDLLEQSIKEVVEQLVKLKEIKESRSVFDTTIDLWDLIVKAFNRGCFDKED